MKINKAFLVGMFILAIITLGAVSAADEAGNLTVSDEAVDVIESPADEIEVAALDNDDGGDILGEKENISMEITKPDDLFCGDYFTIDVKIPANATGEVDLYIGDSKYYWDGCWENDEVKEYWLNYAVYVPGDINCKVTYSAGEDDLYNDAQEEFTLHLNNTAYEIKFNDNVIYYDNMKLSVEGPRQINMSNVVVEIKGKKYQVIHNYDDGNDYVDGDLSVLDYGSNTAHISYPGDNMWGEYSADKNVYLQGRIVYPSKIVYGDAFNATLTLPADASGKLELYSKRQTGVDDWDEPIYDTVLEASAIMKNGFACVSLDNLTVGKNSLIATFNGTYEVGEEYISLDVYPKVTVPKTIVAGDDDAYILVEVSDGCGGKIYVDKDWQDWAEAYVDDTEIKFSLSDLKACDDTYDISVRYETSDEEVTFDCGNYHLYVVDSIDFNMSIRYENSEVIPGDMYVISLDIPKWAEGLLELYVDNKLVDTYNSSDDDDYYPNWEMDFDTTNLTLGKYDVLVKFISDKYGNSSVTTELYVVVAEIKIPDKLIANNDRSSDGPSRILVRVPSESTGSLNIIIDGQPYQTIAVNGSEEDVIALYLEEIARGKHNVTVTYVDDKQASISKSNTVDFDYVIVIYPHESYYGKDTVIEFYLPKMIGNGDLSITIDGKTYDWINDNGIKVITSDLTMGRHYLVARYMGDEKYPLKDFVRDFKTLAQIEAPGDKIALNSNESVSLTLPDDADGKLKVTVYTTIGEGMDEDWVSYIKKTIPLVDGKASYSLGDLPAGSYNIEAEYTGDDYDVERLDHNFEVIPVDFGSKISYLGENRTLLFYSPDNDPSALNITLKRYLNSIFDDDIVMEDVFSTSIPVVNGKVNYTFSDLELGRYRLFIIQKYDNHPGYEGDIYFEVLPTKAELPYGDVLPDEKYPIFIELPDDANGKAIVSVYSNYFDDDTYFLNSTVYDVKGSIDIGVTIAPTDDDGYGIYVNYTGNYGRYYENSWIDIVECEGVDPNIAVDADDAVIGDDVIINVTSPEFSSSEMTLTIDNKTYDLDVIKGQSSLAVSDLKLGKYDVTVTFKGDLRYSNQTKVVQVEVTKKQPAIDVGLDYADVLTVNVNVANATGKVKVNGNEATLVNGKASVEVSDLADGYNTIEVTYEGDDTYDKANATAEVFVMTKEQTNATIIVDGVEYPVELVNGSAVIDTNRSESVNATIIVDGVEYPVVLVNGTAVIDTNKTETKKASEFSEITIGDDQSVSFTLKDEDGKVIADASIAYAVNGKADTLNTDKDGKFTINGENGALIVAKYAGNDNITGTNMTLKLNSPAVPTVVKVASQFNITDRAITIKGYAVDGKAGEQGIYYATALLDANGNPIANAYIEFAVNNKIYNRTTNENGTFDPYKLNMVRAGRYTMAFNYAGDDNYTNAFACVCVDLDKKPITIKADKKTTYKASAKNKVFTVTLSTKVCSSRDGKAHLSPKEVKLTVNGVTYTQTSKKGQATFKITNLNKKGKYAASITVEGDKTYEGASASVKFIVTK